MLDVIGPIFKSVRPQRIPGIANFVDDLLCARHSQIRQTILSNGGVTDIFQEHSRACIGWYRLPSYSCTIAKKEVADRLVDELNLSSFHL